MDHVIRYLPRDFGLFARMNAGDQYPQAWKHAHDMLNEQLAELRRAGRIVRKGSEDYERLHRQYVPPYDIPVGSGRKLCFQRQYREFWLEPGRRGSFSRTMKPDVVMGQGADEDTARLIVLDAKYRIKDGLNEALNSIHTYRDALVREAETGSVEGIVTAAYLLAPHLPELNEETGYRDTAMPGRLFHPEYRRSFCFGAVTLRPGMTVGELGAVLRTIAADATSFGTVSDSLGVVATRETPIVEGKFPLDGSRFEGLLLPIVGGPAFTIRKKPLQKIKDSLTGPVAMVVSLLGVATAGVSLIYGSEFSDFTRRLIMLVLVIGLLVSTSSILLSRA